MRYTQAKYDKIDNINSIYRQMEVSPKFDIIGVVYENIYYPIINEIEHFIYLGGQTVRMVLRSKCIIKDTGKTKFYEAVASDHDIEIGKSPIIPIGCSTDKNLIPIGVNKIETSI